MNDSITLITAANKKYEDNSGRMYGTVQRSDDPPSDGPTLNPCADFDHKYECAVTKYRVYKKDLDILVANWKKKDSQLPGDCPRCGEAAKGQEAKTLDVDTLVKWLEEIWLDPEVQKTIDEKAWQELIESLKEPETGLSK